MPEAKKGFLALAEAFTILAKYSDEGYTLGAEHDIIYTPVQPGSLSPDDRGRLDELGWHESEEFNCMAMFT